MNATIVSNINGGVSNQQVASGSHSSLLLSSIEFALTEVKTNFSASSYQGKYLTKLTGKEEIFNGQNKTKNCDQNKNPIENTYLSINGNKEKSSEDSIPIPKVQLYTGKIHVEWNQVYKIGAGLNNLGNTCFMNTVIQCLTYCPPLANYLLHDNDHSSKCSVSGFCMMCLLQKHMKRAIGKTGEVIKPLDVYQRLKLIAKHFQFGRQEDAHEFLRYVIDHLWKSCLPQTNGVTKLDSASKETTVINKIFGGYHRSQVICLRCKKESNTFDHFMDFILDIKQNVMTLEKALEKFTLPELLQQENCYKCPKCKMKVEAQKRFSVYRAPTVATFQLKRFDYNRSFGGKITKQITYPEKLNLRPYMSETQGDPVWYRLNAVLVHSGPTCNSGHYYCYVKNSNGLWYIMDDQRVHQVSLNQVLSQSAYVLFYIKMENSERTAMKKCLENKNTMMKGTIPNSHFSKISEMSNLKSIPLGEKNSPFPSSKLYSSPNSIKKFSISNQNREKIPFGLQTNGSPTQLTSPKNRIGPLEPLSTTHGGLVPYVEDSSESSDASESSPPSQMNTSIKHHMKNGSIESYRSSPHLEIKAKLSKSVFSIPSPIPKVSATGSWIVTEAPHTTVSSSSNVTGVTSTTDWQVIEASDLKLNESFQTNDNSKDYARRESSSSLKISPAETITSKHLANSDDQENSLNGTMKSAGHESSPSQKCNFRRQIQKNKTNFLEDEETDENSFKRKSSDSYSKISKDSPYTEHSESRHSPVPKKVKYTENVPFLNQENGVRNSSSHIDNSPVQRLSVPHCDNNSRTSVVNGLSSPGEGFRGSSSKNSSSLNASTEKDKKFSVFSKGKLDSSFSSSKPLQYGKEKLPISNSGETSPLYGTELPSWREENHYRPSIISTHENRRIFDDYDHEFDRGKVRKMKMKDRYQYFHQKNPFQKHANRYHGKYKSKFSNNHHNHRRFDSRHSWKSNHGSNYNRYRNHPRHY